MADPNGPTPRDRYEQRLARHAGRRDAAARRSLLLSNTRAVTFVAAIAAWILVEELAFPAARLALAAGVGLTVAFVAQIVMHRRVRRTERWEGALAAIARQGLFRLARDWSALDEDLPRAERAPEPPDPEHAFARDLGLTGRASLVRLAGPVTSERGRSILRAWLLEPTTPAVAAARQGAVRELAPLHELRAELVAHGRLAGLAKLEGLGRFFAWAESGDRGRLPAVARLSAWVLPPLTTVGVVGYFVLGWLPWFIVPAVAQLEVLRRNHRWLAHTLTESVVGGPALRALVPQLALVSEQRHSDPLLTALTARLGRGTRPAHSHVERLSGLLDTVESRRNPFYAGLAPVFMLDVHLCAALERWRRAHGEGVRDWLEALGEWEAISALATLAHDHPDWSYPTFTEGPEAELRATGLGHPLLPPAACVRNDVTVGPPGSFLFVTGSNMSGKSTLLRAIGVNAVLADAGAPVCADALMLPPVQVHTSMRVEDSLAGGVSLFMAELLRIKGVVEAADRAAARGERVLYLLDEVLQGTNSAERRIAARRVIRHLLAAGAIGAVSTHDLGLADAADLGRAAHAVHFREEVRAGDGTSHPEASLTFDYRLREGIATTRNALALLDAVGLGGDELDGEDGASTPAP